MEIESQALKKIIRFLSNYGVVLLLASIAIIQLANAHNGLSRWKGGGFGSYSEIHYSQVKIFVAFEVQKDELVDQEFEFEETDELNRLMQIAQRFPSEENCLALAKEASSISKLSKINIEVWRPSFNPITHKFRRNKSTSYSFSK